MRHVFFTAIAACAATISSTARADMFNGVDVDIEYWAGVGANQSVLVVDWQSGRSLAFGFRWDGVATGGTLLDAVIAASGDRFYREYVTGQGVNAIFGLGYDVDGDGFAKTDPDDYYAEGWLTDGYWSYWTRTDAGDWAFGSAYRSRALVDGAWDGWSWAANFRSSPPVVPVVPEPAAACLPVLGLTLAALRRKRKA